MSSSNNTLKKISDLSIALGQASELDSESDVLAAVKKRFSANASRTSNAPTSTGETLTSSSSGAPTLQALTQLIANTTEAYTAALFRVNLAEETVELAAAQTLSRDLIPGAKFSFGQGLVGWAAENKKRVVASPFELDSTTLMYYSKDQELKSFIAIPIFNSSSTLLGVLAVDSKKSYAFSQMVDKVICDCAAVAGQFFELTTAVKVVPKVSQSRLEQILEILRRQKDETTLLSAASDLPQDFIIRDSLVVLSLAENGSGKGVFYSRASESVENNRLLEIVCRHKKLISAERSVQALRADELGRTFLSIPIRSFHKEAGSLNLLSKPGESFSLDQISSLEQISETIGRELERCRLRSLYGRDSVFSSSISGSNWSSFVSRADKAIQIGPHSLIRFKLSDKEQFELNCGVEVVGHVCVLIFQLLEQLRGTDGLLFELSGAEFLMLCSTTEKERVLGRLKLLLGKQESKKISSEVLNKLSSLISFKSVDSSSSLRSIEQLRVKTLEEGSWLSLSGLASVLKSPVQKNKVPLVNESKTQVAAVKNLSQQDWNW